MPLSSSLTEVKLGPVMTSCHPVKHVGLCRSSNSLERGGTFTQQIASPVMASVISPLWYCSPGSQWNVGALLICSRAEPAGGAREHRTPSELFHLGVSAHGHGFENCPVKIQISSCKCNNLCMFAGSCAPIFHTF